MEEKENLFCDLNVNLFSFQTILTTVYNDAAGCETVIYKVKSILYHYDKKLAISVSALFFRPF